MRQDDVRSTTLVSHCTATEDVVARAHAVEEMRPREAFPPALSKSRYIALLGQREEQAIISVAFQNVFGLTDILQDQ